MLEMEPSERSRRRPLRGANTQTVPVYSSAGLGEMKLLSTLPSLRVQTQFEDSQLANSKSTQLQDLVNKFFSVHIVHSLNLQ